MLLVIVLFMEVLIDKLRVLIFVPYTHYLEVSIRNEVSLHDTVNCSLEKALWKQCSDRSDHVTSDLVHLMECKMFLSINPCRQKRPAMKLRFKFVGKFLVNKKKILFT